MLALAGAVEHASEHPIAQAIARAARDELGSLPRIDGFVSREGLGVEGVVDGHGVQVGRPAWSLTLPEELEAARRAAESHGRTTVAVAWDGEVRGLLAVADGVNDAPALAQADRRAGEGALERVGRRQRPATAALRSDRVLTGSAADDRGTNVNRRIDS